MTVGARPVEIVDTTTRDGKMCWRSLSAGEEPVPLSWDCGQVCSWLMPAPLLNTSWLGSQLGLQSNGTKWPVYTHTTPSCPPTVVRSMVA